MCGRYWLYDKPEEIAERYGAKTIIKNYTGGSEVFPTHTVPVIINDEGNKISLFKWGFPNPVKKGNIINARSESIDTKNMFKKHFLRQRCLIPANGFFEWKREGREKVKYKIKLENECLFSMAGIYGNFTDINGEHYTGFVIITTLPNNVIAKIHNRMPAIIPAEEEKIWLSEDSTDPGVLKELLKPYESENLHLIAEDDHTSHGNNIFIQKRIW